MPPLNPKSIFTLLSIHFIMTSSLTRKKGGITSPSPLHPNALILFLENYVIPLGYCDVTFTPSPLTHERMFLNPRSPTTSTHFIILAGGSAQNQNTVLIAALQK